MDFDEVRYSWYELWPMNIILQLYYVVAINFYGYRNDPTVRKRE